MTAPGGKQGRTRPKPLRHGTRASLPFGAIAAMGDSEAANVWRSSLIEQAVAEKGYSHDRGEQLVDDLANREPPDD